MEEEDLFKVFMEEILALLRSKGPQTSTEDVSAIRVTKAI